LPIEPQLLCQRYWHCEGFNMKSENEVGTAGNSRRGAGMAVRILHPMVMRYRPSTAAANGQVRSRIEADTAGRDTPISIWWDHLPGRERQSP
jgi:hypothetical protein